MSFDFEKFIVSDDVKTEAATTIYMRFVLR